MFAGNKNPKLGCRVRIGQSVRLCLNAVLSFVKIYFYLLIIYILFFLIPVSVLNDFPNQEEQSVRTYQAAQQSRNKTDNQALILGRLEN